ncbi:hypothetical protein OV142_15275 [Nannocystis sp. SCPEA4]|nr:hypothetical protein [Nannocystis sp. SCPEA4]
MLIGLLGCEPGFEQTGGAPPDVKVRSGTTEIAVDVISGEHACFKLSYACDQPDKVTVTVDAGVQLSWSRPEHDDGDSIGLAPPVFCHSTHKLSAASHTFGLTAECAGVSSSDSVSAITSPPPFRIASLMPNKTTYKLADEIVLELDAEADGLIVTANFSAVDSTYVAGSETVQPLGGGKYRIRRNMTSTGNTRVSGDYVVPVSVSDGTAVKTRDVPIRWLRSGYPRVALADATFIAGGAPTRSTSPSIANLTLYIGALTAQGPSAPALFEPLVDEVGGRPFSIGFSTSAPIGDTVRIEMRDTARSGAFVATYHAEVLPMLVSSTFYSVSGLLVGNPLPYGQPSANLQFRVVLPDGTASAWQGSVLAWPGQQGEVTVTGTVSYEYDDCRPDTSAPLGVSPQYYPDDCNKASKPARRVLVEVTNDCNQSHRQHAGEDGKFILWLPDTCANEEFRVVVHSVSRKVAGARVAVGGWNNGAINSKEQLTANPAHYSTHSAVVATFDPPFGNSVTDVGHVFIPLEGEPDMAWAAHIIDNGMTALDYYANFVDPADILPLNVSWATNGPDLEEKNWFVHSVHPSLIHLRPRSTNAFSLAHEISHYIHFNFMHAATTYGRFSEPMAVANAAMITKSSWMSVYPDAVYEDLDFNGDYLDGIGGPGVNGFQQADLKFFPEHSDFEDCQNREDECCPLEDDDPEQIPLCVQGPYGWVWRVFMDLHDGTGIEPWDKFYPVGGGAPQFYGNFDDVDGGGGFTPSAHKLADVMFGYLGGGHLPENMNRDDRGLEFSDLVDVLDGMICRGHMTQAQAEPLLKDAMNYKYDFDGVLSCN